MEGDYQEDNYRLGAADAFDGEQVEREGHQEAGDTSQYRYQRESLSGAGGLSARLL